jgi:hypothetical protein
MSSLFDIFLFWTTEPGVQRIAKRLLQAETAFIVRLYKSLRLMYLRLLYLFVKSYATRFTIKSIQKQSYSIIHDLNTCINT